jgi:hypothetical protein
VTAILSIRNKNNPITIDENYIANKEFSADIGVIIPKTKRRKSAFVGPDYTELQRGSHRYNNNMK